MGWSNTVLAGCLASLAWAPVAMATEGLAWGWPEGESHRYFLEADVQTPYLLQFNAQANDNIRVAKFTLTLNTLCTNIGDMGKKGFELKCSIDDVRLVAMPTASDAGRGLLGILDEIDAGYLGASATIMMGRDGYVRSVSLDGVTDRIRRMREMEETMRLMLARSVSALDLGLPRKGDDGGSAWLVKKTTVFQLPSKFGSFGSSTIQSKVVEQDGAQVLIQTTGRGSVASGESAVVGTPEGAAVDRPRDTYDMVIQSIARFDTERGLLVERVVTAEGNVTASSQTAENGVGVAYIQVLNVKLADDKQIPPFAENGEIN